LLRDEKDNPKLKELHNSDGVRDATEAAAIETQKSFFRRLKPR
jgi:hypothetical protein